MIKEALSDTLTGQAALGLIMPFVPYQSVGYGQDKWLAEQSRNTYQHPVNAISGQPYPDNNPKTAEGAKKIPLELAPPSAVHALAEAFSDGAKKYGPYNWREKTISSSIYYGAALRHLQAWWDGEDVALDSGINHLHHALACIAVLIDGNSVGKLNDNRPPRGAASDIQKKWVNEHSNT